MLLHTPHIRAETPFTQSFKLLLPYIAATYSLLNQSIIICKSSQLQISVLKSAPALIKIIRENSNHTKHMPPGPLNSLHCRKRALSCRYEILHHDNISTLRKITLHLSTSTMILWFRPHINKRLTQKLSHKHSPRNSTGSNTSNIIGLRIILLHYSRKTLIYNLPRLWIRQDLSVITINRRLPARCPHKRFIRTQPHRFNLQQLSGYNFYLLPQRRQNCLHQRRLPKALCGYFIGCPR